MQKFNVMVFRQVLSVYVLCIYVPYEPRYTWPKGCILVMSYYTLFKSQLKLLKDIILNLSF